jgi:site-specific recombinase XerD
MARKGRSSSRMTMPRTALAELAASAPRRHAFATLMLEDGEELAVVSKALGHSNLCTTADVYAHYTPAMRDRTAARMDAILARRSG